jgi:hypothetical protein
VRGGLLDVADGVEEDCEGESFQAAEDVCDFADGRLDDRWDMLVSTSKRKFLGVDMNGAGEAYR